MAEGNKMSLRKVNNLTREILGNPMTKGQKRFLKKLQRKVKTKKITVDQARAEWNKKYKLW